MVAQMATFQKTVTKLARPILKIGACGPGFKFMYHTSAKATKLKLANLRMRAQASKPGEGPGELS